MHMAILDLYCLADVDAIPVRISEHKCPQAKVLVLQAFDNPCPMSLTNSVERINIVHHQVSYVKIRSLVSGL